jgi:hypothetical protein
MSSDLSGSAAIDPNSGTIVKINQETGGLMDSMTQNQKILLVCGIIGFIIAVGIGIYLIYGDSINSSIESSDLVNKTTDDKKTDNKKTHDKKTDDKKTVDKKKVEPFTNYGYQFEPGRPDMNETNRLLPGYFNKLF